MSDRRNGATAKRRGRAADVARGGEDMGEARVVIYGSSDDLIEVEGDAPGCDEYSAEDATFVLSGPLGSARVRMVYEGVWAITIAQLAEDVPLLTAAVLGSDYSVRATFWGVRSVVREYAEEVA